MMFWMVLRVSVISVSTGVARIGKKRIRCSGGGSTVMSLMRSSSVWLVLSTCCAYQAWLGVEGSVISVLSFPEKSRAKKNRRGSGGLCLELDAWVFGYAQISLPPLGLENQK